MSSDKRRKPVVVCHRCAKAVDEPAAFGHRLQKGTLTVETKLTCRRGVPPGNATTETTSRRRFCVDCAPIVLDILAGLNP